MANISTPRALDRARLTAAPDIPRGFFCEAGQAASGEPLPPQSFFRVFIRNGRLAPGAEAGAHIIPLESFEVEAARRAILANEPVLRPATDSLGRPVILAYLPGGQEVLLVSMLHFADALRQTGREIGMGNLAARICRALIENGSLRKASKSLGISHQTAASEISDAIRIAGVHSQSGLVQRLAQPWLRESIQSERAISLLMTTFGLRPRDAKIATLRAAGLSRPEAARHLGVSQWAMEASCSHVFATLGVTKAPELTRLLVDLMLAADLAERYRQGWSG